MRKRAWLIGILYVGCRFDTSGIDLPPRPDGGESEAEAEAEAESEGEEMFFISYEIGDSRSAVEITVQARFITGPGLGEWQQVGAAADAIRVALAIPVPRETVAVDVWVHYVQANGRGRASCEGMELFIPVGNLRVTRIGTLLVGSLVLGGAGEPGNCSHRYAVQ